MGLIIWFLDAIIILILINVGLNLLAFLFSNKITGILTIVTLGFLAYRFL